MVIPYVFKKCTKCGKWLVASNEYFAKQKKGKYGLNSQCKECDKKYREANKERIAECNKKYRETHIEYDKKRKKEYYNKNKKHELERTRRWRQTPEGQINEANRRARRRIKEQSQGNGITKEQWIECMSFFEFKCAYSGKTLSKETRSLDHIKPISKGGENEIWNLVPMYKIYNSSKRTQDLLTWYPKQEYFSEERLDKIYEWQEYAFKKWSRENLTEAE